jgi:hypothetical protein
MRYAVAVAETLNSPTVLVSATAWQSSRSVACAKCE